MYTRKRLMIFIALTMVMLCFFGCGISETEVSDRPVEFAVQSTEELAVNSSENEKTEPLEDAEMPKTEGPEEIDEIVEPVIYEFELSDFYSEDEGVFVVPGYPWSEYENPGIAIKEEYDVEMPELYRTLNPEIFFSFTVGDYEFLSPPYFSAGGSSYVLDLKYSSEDTENVPEMAEALIAELTELYGQPEVDDIYADDTRSSDDEIFEWSYRWICDNGESKTFLSVFYYHSESSKMNYEIQLHLQKVK